MESRALAFVAADISATFGVDDPNWHAPPVYRADGRRYVFRAPWSDGPGRPTDAAAIYEGAMIEAYWDAGPWRDRDLGIAGNRERFYTVMRALDIEPTAVLERVYRDGKLMPGPPTEPLDVDATDTQTLADWVSKRRRAWREWREAVERAAELRLRELRLELELAERDHDVAGAAEALWEGERALNPRSRAST